LDKRILNLIKKQKLNQKKMKSTILMLVAIVMFILTWLLLTTVGYLLSDVSTFREVATNGGVIMLMLIFGWIPSLVVCSDLDEKLDN